MKKSYDNLGLTPTHCVFPEQIEKGAPSRSSQDPSGLVTTSHRRDLRPPEVLVIDPSESAQ